jgi:hypothetical protein
MFEIDAATRRQLARFSRSGLQKTVKVLKLR